MSFPGLYNEVMHVPQKTTTVPTAAAVFTHVLHLLMYLLLYLDVLYLPLYLLHTHVLYLLLCSTYYVLIYVRTTLLIYIRTYILKIGTGAEKIGTYCTYILYAGTAPTDVRTGCTYCWCTHVYWRRKTTSCCKYVPTAIRTYLLHSPGTRVPADVRTHLLHTLLFLQMNVRTHRTYCFK